MASWMRALSRPRDVAVSVTTWRPEAGEDCRRCPPKERTPGPVTWIAWGESDGGLEHVRMDGGLLPVGKEGEDLSPRAGRRLES